MATTVVVLKKGKKAVRVSKGRVACHGRLDGRRVAVLVHRFRHGKATCVWRLPATATGKLVSAVVVVHRGHARARAPFRARIS